MRRRGIPIPLQEGSLALRLIAAMVARQRSMSEGGKQSDLEQNSIIKHDDITLNCCFLVLVQLEGKGTEKKYQL
jgi:hypothetical protein